MKQLTVCIDDGLQGEVVYRAEISHTEEEYKELENELEYVRIIKDSAEETLKEVREENRKLKERIDILYEFIERNDKLVDEVIDEEDLDKLNRYIYIDDDLVDRTLESED